MRNKYVYGIVTAVVVTGILIAVGLFSSESASYQKPSKVERMVLGARDAAIIVQEYSDFQCPACKAAAPEVKRLVETYGDSVRFEYHHYPLTQRHANAFSAALASECANDQGKFWEMHDKIFEKQDQLTKGNLKSMAGELGLDQPSFDACLDSRAHTDTVNADMERGNQLGVSGTPTFFVNGTETKLADLEKAIQDLLVK